MSKYWIGLFTRHLSWPGMAFGALLFAMSLTPSLLPRTAPVQAVLSGLCFAAGYAFGACVHWVWNYLELSWPREQAGRWLNTAIGLVCLILVLIAIGMTPHWQNTVRAAMGMGPIENTHLVLFLTLAILIATVLLLIGTALTTGVKIVARRLVRYVPNRVAFLSSLVIVGVVVGLIVDGVLLRTTLRAADNFFERLDGLAGQFGDPPSNPLRSGSAASLVPWESIGRDGRVYVASGPDKADLEDFLGAEALDPLRIFVGLRSAPTLEQRVQLAMDEMERVGAFERSVLVIAMPVGTGWVDPSGVDTLEYLLRGDVASVALQYSYLLSPLSLVVEPEYGIEAAQALFAAVYGHWRTLPEETRPRLYLYGLSLGAHTSQYSVHFFDLFDDPIDGALWVGPPFASPIWRWATANREPGSPRWRPQVGTGSSVRFANRGAQLLSADTDWGVLRVAFLQYPTDPVVFFDWSALYHAPEWMVGERGEGVSPALNWYPVVTLLQLGMDMALGMSAPVGFGHVYSMSDNIDAWRALIEPEGWDDVQIARLKAHLAEDSLQTGGATFP